MANSTGFSAAEEIFGTISGLTAKESSDGMSGSVAEATNEFGDTIAHDEFAQLAAPSVTYAVSANVSTLPALGKIVSWNSKKIMITQIQVTTSAGQPPSVTISGQEVHSTATEKRTYAVAISLAARCKAQDVASGFGAISASAGYALTSCTTTYSIDFVKASVAGDIVAACGTHGKVEVNATITDPTGTGSLTEAQGWAVTNPISKTAPDESYVTKTVTATKWIVGTEATGNASA